MSGQDSNSRIRKISNRLDAVIGGIGQLLTLVESMRRIIEFNIAEGNLVLLTDEEYTEFVAKKLEAEAAAAALEEELVAEDAYEEFSDMSKKLTLVANEE